MSCFWLQKLIPRMSTSCITYGGPLHYFGHNCYIDCTSWLWLNWLSQPFGTFAIRQLIIYSLINSDFPFWFFSFLEFNLSLWNQVRWTCWSPPQMSLANFTVQRPLTFFAKASMIDVLQSPKYISRIFKLICFQCTLPLSPYVFRGLRKCALGTNGLKKLKLRISQMTRVFHVNRRLFYCCVNY